MNYSVIEVQICKQQLKKQFKVTEKGKEGTSLYFLKM